jgi:hypothetical protein
MECQLLYIVQDANVKTLVEPQQIENYDDNDVDLLNIMLMKLRLVFKSFIHYLRL